MDFSEADKLSAITDNQFILDLMPQHPIYVDLLPEAARAVIGKCHADGQGAQRLLEWEGFSFSNVIDIFDAGPLLSAERDHIRTLRESRLVSLQPEANLSQGHRALVATPSIRGYRCVSTRAALDGRDARVAPGVLAALKLDAGAEALVWIDHAN